ncbi:Os02g0581000 [Oryza sativa Japonica Group]|uniref:GPI ethanolamine phosphate transferase 1 n=1 Tax=Oryza sativa subsp. japonica TaxID=39947 RepID=Q0E033_ORYSJ|nr:Os02g0581000 [Oryza sativa Japonica Group]|eukprot:NP_001047241.1 Os02g0581000 [Oryza sativa Japonica Group]
MAGRARPQPQPQPHSPSASTRRRERWLVVLGVALHAVYMLSIFDIYFKSPIVHGMAPEPPRFSAPPAKRLVLLVADGLRADKFFEPDERGRYRAPFLRGVIEEKGRWGVSHARPPTESRPGHVAIIAGFYEDPSAVTKVVETVSIVLPIDILGYLVLAVACGLLYLRFIKDLFCVENLGYTDGRPILLSLILYSIKVDTLSRLAVQILFPYSAAAYLTVPGVLIPMNMKTLRQFQGLLNRSFEDAKLRQLLLQDKLVIFLHLLGCDTNGHAHRPYSNIYLNNVKVVDQIAESMYNLMESYFNDNQTAYVFTADHGMSDKGYTCGSAMPAEFCWKLTYALFEIKQEMKQSSSLYFKPFKPLANYSLVLDQIEDLISAKDYENAMKHSEELRSMALAGLHYFQTYDWFMLMTTITLGYIGWMVNLILHVLQSYTSFPANLQKRTQVYAKNTSVKVYIVGCFIMGFSSIILLLEKSPLLYHAYLFMTIFLWTRIVQNFEFIKAVWRELSNMPFKYTMNLLNISVIALFILEFLVMSFFDRKLYTWCFLILGILASSCVAIFIQASSALAVYVWLSCWFLSLFTLMPAEIPENNNLVIFSGALIILTAMASRWMATNNNNFWLYLTRANKRDPQFSKLFFVQVVFVAISSIMVWISTSHRSQNKQLHPLHQMINWLIAGFAMVLPLFSPSSVLSRLTSIFLGFAPPFLLLSIGYEAVFYSAFAMVLMGWIFVESANLYCSEQNGSARRSSIVEGSIFGYDERCLQLSDLRIPLLFTILFNVAFFGTGNFASIASFEISSVYRFITIFSPFLMAALLIFKLFIPFMLVICTFSAITKVVRIPRLGCYFLVILLSDVMTIHFFFLVRNTGSWMEIGNSISHFGIVSAQVVFVLLLFALTNIFTKDIEVSSRQLSSRKVM